MLAVDPGHLVGELVGPLGVRADPTDVEGLVEQRMPPPEVRWRERPLAVQLGVGPERAAHVTREVEQGPGTRTP